MEALLQVNPAVFNGVGEILLPMAHLAMSAATLGFLPGEVLPTSSR